MAIKKTNSSVSRILLPDQLGPHFVDDPAQKLLLVVPFDMTFGRQLHIQKAVWWMSAILRRLATSQNEIELIECENLTDWVDRFSDVAEVIGPTSYQARKAFSDKNKFLRLPSRGFVTSEADFQQWILQRAGKRLKLEDFYRAARIKHKVLLDESDNPLGGSWNYDAENRLPPPRNKLTLELAASYQPQWDEIDEKAYSIIQSYQAKGVKYLGQFSKHRYFAQSHQESINALDNFLDTRIKDFGPYEDASLTADWQMAHSLLSAPLNIGLIDPKVLIEKASLSLKKGAPLNSVEGFIRQIMGWRDFIWHLYWHFGEEYILSSNELSANKDIPDWMSQLNSDEPKAQCLKQITSDLSERAWLHHIQRLMILGNWTMQQGVNPQQLVDWFDRMFIDGHQWVMAANVIGMSQYADGGRMSTKPYAAGGAYLNKMTDFCKSCVFKPEVRVGPTACPFTAGYWKFINQHQARFVKNPRMSRAVYGLNRLSDRDQLMAENSNQS